MTPGRRTSGGARLNREIQWSLNSWPGDMETRMILEALRLPYNKFSATVAQAGIDSLFLSLSPSHIISDRTIVLSPGVFFYPVISRYLSYPPTPDRRSIQSPSSKSRFPELSSSSPSNHGTQHGFLVSCDTPSSWRILQS